LARDWGRDDHPRFWWCLWRGEEQRTIRARREAHKVSCKARRMQNRSARRWETCNMQHHGRRTHFRSKHISRLQTRIMQMSMGEQEAHGTRRDQRCPPGRYLPWHFETTVSRDHQSWRRRYARATQACYSSLGMDKSDGHGEEDRDMVALHCLSLRCRHAPLPKVPTHLR
jgi:hypothetical protein